MERKIKKYYCKICNKIISRNSGIYGKGRCMKCYQLRRKGKNNPHWKGGKTLKSYYCKKCKQSISLFSALYGSGLCRKCADKQHSIRMRGSNNPFKGLSGKKNSHYGKPAYHGKGAYYKNIWMRSSWEIAYAKYLDKNNIKWKYEPKRFYFKNCTYTPDFYLPEKDLYIEIKGYWRPGCKKRIKLFRNNYPNLDLQILIKSDLKKLGILK